MDLLAQILISFGVNISSNVVYDLIKSRLSHGSATASELANELHSKFPNIAIENAKIISQTAINILAEHGDIEIKETSIYAKDSVWMKSTPGTQFVFGDNSISSTASGSEIAVGQNGIIKGSNGGQVHQNQDGSIDISA